MNEEHTARTTRLDPLIVTVEDNTADAIADPRPATMDDTAMAVAGT